MEILLSVVLTVSGDFERLKNISHWLPYAAVDNIQIIFVLDNISEQDFQILRALCIESKVKFQFIRNNFGNPGSARNAGAHLADTQWITFWDCDDIPVPQVIRALAQEAQEENCDIGISNYSVIDFQSLVEINQTKHCKKLMKVALNPGIWRMVLNKKIYKEIEFPPYEIGEDQCFFAELLTLSDSIYWSNSIGYKYTIKGISQITNYSNKWEISKARNYILRKIWKAGTKKRAVLLVMFLRMSLTSVKKLRTDFFSKDFLKKTKMS